MKSLTNSQKLAVLIIIILVEAIMISGILILNKEKAGTGITTTKNSTEGTSAVNPAANDKTSYENVVKSTGEKMQSGTATANELIDLGVAYYNLGNPDKAVEAYQKATTSDPNSAHAYNNLANILRDQQKYDEAEQDYRKAISLDINYTTAYLNLAHMLYNFKNDSIAAIAVLQSGVANNPDDQTLKTILEEYEK